MVLAALGAVVVFVSVLGYTGSVRAEAGVRTEVLVLTRTIPAYTRITENDLRRAQVPKRWSPSTLITNPAQLAGKVAGADLPAGAFLQHGMLVPHPALEPGQRAISIRVDAETGVAGMVQKGMYVDIYATYQVQKGSRQESCAARIVKSALVLQIDQVRSVRDEKNTSVTESIMPITFALDAVDSLKLTREESFANKLRLVLIGGTGRKADGVSLPPVCETIPAR
ncbi:Flp pilus assembly protein CpaB [Actinomadura rugatobispora]|uniref:Flp pilus assembly protein CpaB n=1 Tax=Actinomadura rugatobispora TaxID=1994 RepID=A0ABW0ZQW1_9ACTN|nr:hypothetical protein GCM10010200_096490 [Actinomadura rugatobispora]